MVEIYYTSALVVSVVLMLVYSFFFHKHFDVHLSFLFLFVPINNLAQYLLSKSVNFEESIVAYKFVYLSSCFLILNITLLVFEFCNIRINRYLKLLMYTVTVATLVCALQMGQNDLYYKSVEFELVNGVATLKKVYGPLHALYYAMLLSYFTAALSVIIYRLFKKAQISRRFIVLIAIPETISLLGFFIGRSLIPTIEITPLAYDITLIVYLIIVRLLVLYDIPETVIDTVAQKGDTGFISFDFKYRYLGSNDTAKRIFPELKNFIVDVKINENEDTKKTFWEWLNKFSEDNSCDKAYYKSGDKVYLINVGFLFNGKRKCGYQLYITDDTKNQQYISLLDSFNTELKAEVAQKTADIMDMHNKLIMSMATMVESRDNSTGGHIKRTSEGVRILVGEMMGKSDFNLSESFCNNLIKAAPMHDLGKIAVDDAVLRKPGRFTAEEFEKMKAHAAEGARIVDEILAGTDDKEFCTIAENVAHYHHERWDGSGYPSGLKGEQIPLEARIMAIADVFDALVSKRVYKDAMSFEKANEIILEGIGSQFDKKLEPYYKAAFPKLEEYYNSISTK